MEFGAFLNSLKTKDDIFKDAIAHNDTDTIASVIDDVSDINMVVEKQLKRRSLHLACRHGNSEIVALLLARGADPQLEDNLEILPWHMALHSGQQKCLRMILAGSPIVLSSSLWDHVEPGTADHPALPSIVPHRFVLKLTEQKRFAIASSLVSTFMKALVPGMLSTKGQENVEKFISICSSSDILLKLFVLCGHANSILLMDKLMSNSSGEMRLWLEQVFRNPWSLQALCRKRIRQQLCYNTFYSTSRLDIPEMLKVYLAFNYDDEYELTVLPLPPVPPFLLRNVMYLPPHP